MSENKPYIPFRKQMIFDNLSAHFQGRLIPNPVL